MCGIFGVHGHPEASNLTYLGLHALQHRGQESAGIVASDGSSSTPTAGWAWSRTSSPRRSRSCPATRHRPRALLHGGRRQLKNAQPLTVEYAGGHLAVAHNGNLVNAQELRTQLEADGAIFQSDSDTEVVIHLIARRRAAPFERMRRGALQGEGRLQLLFLTGSAGGGARPVGLGPCPGAYRPLSLRGGHPPLGTDI